MAEASDARPRGEAVDGRSVRAERRREARRDQILDAAKRVFAARGYRETSISAVIAEAAISRGTFYAYFDSKDALFCELVEQLAARMMAVVEDVQPGHGERPMREAFENVERVVDLLFSDRDLATVVFRVAVGVDPAVDRIIHHLYEYLYEEVVAALVRGVEFDRLRRVDEKIAAVAFVGAIKEVLYQFAVVDAAQAPERSVVAATLFDLALHGVVLRE